MLLIKLKKIKLSKKDILLGISASGSTPYVLSALKYANSMVNSDQIDDINEKELLG